MPLFCGSGEDDVAAQVLLQVTVLVEADCQEASYAALDLAAAQCSLQELPGHHHALNLVGAFVNLGDRRLQGSFRR